MQIISSFEDGKQPDKLTVEWTTNDIVGGINIQP
jgi:hypothetical protein